MGWWLLSSLILNAFLYYAWMHDVEIYKESAYRYERRYYKTLDHYAKKPPGTTPRNLASHWPEGSGHRLRLERMAGELERGEGVAVRSSSWARRRGRGLRLGSGSGARWRKVCMTLQQRRSDGRGR